MMQQLVEFQACKALKLGLLSQLHCAIRMIAINCLHMVIHSTG